MSRLSKKSQRAHKLVSNMSAIKSYHEQVIKFASRFAIPFGRKKASRKRAKRGQDAEHDRKLSDATIAQCLFFKEFKSI